MQAAAPKARPVGELSVCKGKEPEMTFARGLREGEGALEGARGPTRNGCLSCELRPYHPEIIPEALLVAAAIMKEQKQHPRNSVPNVAATGRAPGADRTACASLMQHSAIRKTGHHAYSARRDAPLAGCMRACEGGKGLLVELNSSCMLSWRRSAAACSSLLFPTDWVGRLQNWRPAGH